MKNNPYIFFDIGGVLLHDFSKTNKWEEMMDSLNLSGNSRQTFRGLFRKYEPNICIGTTDLADFIKRFEQEYSIKFPDGYSMLDDFVNRFERNISLAHIVKDLSQNYKIGLLTNMYPGMLKKIQERELLPHIEWDTIIDSSIVHLQKPQSGIYQKAQELSGYEAKDILFIDNAEENINMAKIHGWNTILYDITNPLSSNGKILTFLGIN